MQRISFFKTCDRLLFLFLANKLNAYFNKRHVNHISKLLLENEIIMKIKSAVDMTLGMKDFLAKVRNIKQMNFIKEAQLKGCTATSLTGMQ